MLQHFACIITSAQLFHAQRSEPPTAAVLLHREPDPILGMKVHTCCGTAPHGYLSPTQGLSCTRGGVLHPAVALGCSCCRGTWVCGLCLLHTHLLHLNSVLMHPHCSCNTSCGTEHCSTQSNATGSNSRLWKSKATHP